MKRMIATVLLVLAILGGAASTASADVGRSYGPSDYAEGSDFVWCDSARDTITFRTSTYDSYGRTVYVNTEVWSSQRSTPRGRVWQSGWVQQPGGGYSLDRTLKFNPGQYLVKFTFAFWTGSQYDYRSEWSTGNYNYGYYAPTRYGQPTGYGDTACNL